ncbi:type I-C CRISPR-associated protein Cas8c/Csd1 [Acrocarpospora catenulata]|uniref:type I-C CRISPR-associated protein Cas8c/Csd1 n=1 Tax=Acrocarpospora catenulata TaxID=2836182 RepID=UPI001BDB0585|nr:type I-C CRISPR-associated protein Cas8c/Csd1 [Acrocarpospora catenulata]
MTLLKSLVEHASGKAGVPAYYQDKVIRFVLELNADGSLASAQLTSLANPAEPRMKNGVVHTVPSIVKTSGIAPTLAVDSGEYLFGWVDEATKDPGRVARMHEQSRDLVDQWATADPGGPGQALQRFYRDGHVQQLRRPEGWSRGDLIAIRVDRRFLHDTDSARVFWQQIAGGRKSTGRTGLCLVCGQVGNLLQSIPQQLPARLVPKATQRASLVSVNKATHGFDLQEQLVFTPICDGCGLQVMDTLERLLNDQWSSTVVGEDTRLVWWTKGPEAFDLQLYLEPPDPEQAASLVSAAARGRAPTPLERDDATLFYAMAIGGNVSRVMVRQWIEQPLPIIQANLDDWATDLMMLDTWSGQVRQPKVTRLVAAAGRWISGRNGANGSYAKLGQPGADRPDGLYWALLRSALLAKPLPPKLLSHLVHRIATDGRVDLERAALVRLALRRRLPEHQRELYMPTLNPGNNQPAYLSGRIFAVLEDIQLSAARAEGDEPPNTTFADKYWGRATTSPALVLLAGSKNSRAWLKRMRRKKPGWASAVGGRLDDLVRQLAEAGGPPHTTNLADKSAFILGYHQQRAEQRAARNAPKDDNTPTPDERDSA